MSVRTSVGLSVGWSVITSYFIAFSAFFKLKSVLFALLPNRQQHALFIESEVLLGEKHFTPPTKTRPIAISHLLSVLERDSVFV